jgi:hypothetical protein
MVDDIDRIFDETRRNVIAFYPTVKISPDPRTLKWYLELIPYRPPPDERCRQAIDKAKARIERLKARMESREET